MKNEYLTPIRHHCKTVNIKKSWFQDALPVAKTGSEMLLEFPEIELNDEDFVKCAYSSSSYKTLSRHQQKIVKLFFNSVAGVYFFANCHNLML